MPELPEVETVRRMLAEWVPGRRIVGVRVSRKRLRTASLASLPAKLRGRTFATPRRTGKFLLLDFEGGDTLLSHLGMSGQWLFRPAGSTPDPEPDHVHLKLEFEDGAGLWYLDVRRFGMLRLVRTEALGRDASLRQLGPDPLAERRDGAALRAAARGARTPIKSWLLDQRRIAGLGNIYVSEVLFRAAVDPRRKAGSLRPAEWDRVAAEIPRVLEESIARQGTTFSSYRNPYGEEGGYAGQLFVYDRAGKPCRKCSTPIRRIVQAGRSTFYCVRCQRAARASTGPIVRDQGRRAGDRLTTH